MTQLIVLRIAFWIGGLLFVVSVCTNKLSMLISMQKPGSLRNLASNFQNLERRTRPQGKWVKNGTGGSESGLMPVGGAGGGMGMGGESSGTGTGTGTGGGGESPGFGDVSGTGNTTSASSSSDGSDTETTPTNTTPTPTNPETDTTTSSTSPSPSPSGEEDGQTEGVPFDDGTTQTSTPSTTPEEDEPLPPVTPQDEDSQIEIFDSQGEKTLTPESDPDELSFEEVSDKETTEAIKRENLDSVDFRYDSENNEFTGQVKAKDTENARAEQYVAKTTVNPDSNDVIKEGFTSVAETIEESGRIISDSDENLRSELVRTGTSSNIPNSVGGHDVEEIIQEAENNRLNIQTSDNETAIKTAKAVLNKSKNSMSVSISRKGRTKSVSDDHVVIEPDADGVVGKENVTIEEINGEVVETTSSSASSNTTDDFDSLSTEQQEQLENVKQDIETTQENCTHEISSFFQDSATETLDLVGQTPEIQDELRENGINPEEFANELVNASEKLSKSIDDASKTKRMVDHGAVLNQPEEEGETWSSAQDSLEESGFIHAEWDGGMDTDDVIEFTGKSEDQRQQLINKTSQEINETYINMEGSREMAPIRKTRGEFEEQTIDTESVSKEEKIATEIAQRNLQKSMHDSLTHEEISRGYKEAVF